MTEDRGPGLGQQIATAGVMGAIAGAALAGHRGRRAGLLGALVVAAGMGEVEAVARKRQQPGQIPAIWARLAASGAIAAPLGWLAGKATKAGPIPTATAAGTVAGAMGL